MASERFVLNSGADWPSPDGAPALLDRERVGRYRNAAGKLDFDEQTLPWLDRSDADIDGYVASLPAPEPGLPRRLHQWRRDGFAVFERAIDDRLLDALGADLGELSEDHRRFGVMVGHSQKGDVPVRELSDDELKDRHLRVINFHHASLAAKKIALSAPIVGFLRHVFRERVVAMQSLTFRYGSEQHIHQDFAYVVSGIPSHLAAVWVALEDIHPDAGPLAYYPGSHRNPKFDWGNGLFYHPDHSTRGGDLFEEHIHRQCRKRGLSLTTFLPKRGDAFIWHGSLAHGGSPQVDPDRTRLSYVVHYSTARAFPRSPHDPNHVPTRFEMNGAALYLDPTRPQAENQFKHGAGL
jgi:phytanoyl-CoA hydroxylase